jgi:hypothetical protein
VEELADLVCGGFEGTASGWGGAVDAAQGFAISLLGGAEIALLLEAVEQGVEAPRADAIAVPGELLDHTEAENGFFGGMVEDVEADEAGVEVAVGVPIMIKLRFRHSSTSL